MEIKNKNRKGLFGIFRKIHDKSLIAIDKFSSTEKVIFFVAFVIFFLSSFSLLNKAESLFMTEVPISGGEIHEGVIGYPRYINPVLSAVDVGKDLNSLIYSGLLKATSEGGFIPDIASDYDISEDGLTYTVNLKEDAFFHDGEPVTAYDVEFTIKKILDPIIKSPKAPNWQGVEVSVINEKEIQFFLKKPFSPFIENLTLGILPMHIWKDVSSDAFIWSQKNIDPIGSGPFKVEKISRDTSGLPTYYHLKPFNKYTLNTPYIKDLYMHFYPNEEKLISALNKGEVNSASSISPESAMNLNSKEVKIEKVSLPRIFAVFFNQNQAQVFADKSVRLALDTAIPKQEIVNLVLNGFGSVIDSPIPKYPSLESKQEVTEEEKNTAKEKAIKILSDAGFEKNSDGILEKEDKKGNILLSFNLATSNNPELKAAAELLKTYWESIGVKVEINMYELSDLNQNIIRTRKYDALLFGEVIGRDNDLYPFWHSSERLSPGLNLSMYTNATVDTLLEQARNTTDQEKKSVILEKIETEITKDMPAIFLYSPDFIYVIPKNLKGVSINTITGTSERFLDVHKWYIDTIKVWNIFAN